MRNFKASGLWSTTEDAKHPIAGTLRFRESGLQLTLIGNFKSGWSPRVGTSYPVIHGVVGNSPYGNFVTLYDCFRKHTTLNMAEVGSEAIVCHKAIVGDDHPPIGEAEYQSLDLTFTYLDEWVGWRNIHLDWQPGDGKELVINYSRPEMISFAIRDTTLKVGYSFRVVNSTKRTGITEKAHLVIEPIGRVTANAASDEYAYRLQNLLTFATDTPNEVEDSLLRGDWVSYGSMQVPKRYYLIYNPVFRLKAPKDRLMADNMLFGLGDAREAGLNIFQAWFDFVRRNEAFFIIYFGHLYSRPKYLDEKFRNIMTAFTLLTRSSGMASERTEGFRRAVKSAIAAQYAPEEQKWLSHIIPDEADLEMPFHLLRFLEEHGDIMSQVIDGGFSDFVALVCRTLDFVTRRTSRGGEPVLQGADLHYATEKIRWLIKAIVLKELGFGDEKVKSLIQRNTTFNYLRAV